jgi:hypothetical protein
MRKSNNPSLTVKIANEFTKSINLSRKRNATIRMSRITHKNPEYTFHKTLEVRYRNDWY